MEQRLRKFNRHLTEIVEGKNRGEPKEGNI